MGDDGGESPASDAPDLKIVDAAAEAASTLATPMEQSEPPTQSNDADLSINFDEKIKTKHGFII